jgi:hypothetical protein
MRIVSRCNLIIARGSADIKQNLMPEGSPQTCRVKNVDDVSCLLALGKAVETQRTERQKTKCPREFGGMRGAPSEDTQRIVSVSTFDT